MLSQERLQDPAFLPALLKGALQRLGQLASFDPAFCVSGLPATWAIDTDKARALGARLREGNAAYSAVRVIPEPLGVIYAQLLDTHGQLVGPEALRLGRVAVVDLGHHTADLAIVNRLVVEPASLQTFALGTARPLGELRARLGAAFERDLSMAEVDQVARSGEIMVAGQRYGLPDGWDRPLRENAAAIVAKLAEAWGSGGSLDAILIGGGGAAMPQLAEAILGRFRHAMVVDEPQLAVARGYARLARKLAQEQAR
jgi:plasmid segregation protein ParM